MRLVIRHTQRLQLAKYNRGSQSTHQRLAKFPEVYPSSSTSYDIFRTCYVTVGISVPFVSFSTTNSSRARASIWKYPKTRTWVGMQNSSDLAHQQNTSNFPLTVSNSVRCRPPEMVSHTSKQARIRASYFNNFSVHKLGCFSVTLKGFS